MYLDTEVSLYEKKKKARKRCTAHAAETWCERSLRRWETNRYPSYRLIIYVKKYVAQKIPIQNEDATMRDTGSGFRTAFLRIWT